MWSEWKDVGRILLSVARWFNYIEDFIERAGHTSLGVLAAIEQVLCATNRIKFLFRSPVKF